MFQKIDNPSPFFILMKVRVNITLWLSRASFARVGLQPEVRFRTGPLEGANPAAIFSNSILSTREYIADSFAHD